MSSAVQALDMLVRWPRMLTHLTARVVGAMFALPGISLAIVAVSLAAKLYPDIRALLLIPYYSVLEPGQPIF